NHWRVGGPEAEVVASGDLAGEAFVGAAGQSVVIAGVRRGSTANAFHSVAAEEDGLAAEDDRDIQFEGVLACSTDSVGTVGLDLHRSFTVGLEKDGALFDEVFENPTLCEIAVDDSARKH